MPAKLSSNSEKNKRGVGRPPKDGQKRERIDARLPREMVQRLKAEGVTETIEKALAEYWKRKDPP